MRTGRSAGRHRARCGGQSPGERRGSGFVDPPGADPEHPAVVGQERGARYDEQPMVRMVRRISQAIRGGEWHKVGEGSSAESSSDTPSWVRSSVSLAGSLSSNRFPPVAPIDEGRRARRAVDHGPSLRLLRSPATCAAAASLGRVVSVPPSAINANSDTGTAGRMNAAHREMISRLPVPSTSDSDLVFSRILGHTCFWIRAARGARCAGGEFVRSDDGASRVVELSRPLHSHFRMLSICRGSFRVRKRSPGE